MLTGGYVCACAFYSGRVCIRMSRFVGGQEGGRIAGRGVRGRRREKEGGRGREPRLGEGGFDGVRAGASREEESGEEGRGGGRES